MHSPWLEEAPFLSTLPDERRIRGYSSMVHLNCIVGQSRPSYCRISSGKLQCIEGSMGRFFAQRCAMMTGLARLLCLPAVAVDLPCLSAMCHSPIDVPLTSLLEDI